MQEIIKHSIMLEQRKNLTISGVESVVAFSEVKIVLALSGGDKLYIIGTDLKITNFSKNSGAFTAEGQIVGMSYGGSNFASRIFK